MDVFGNAGRLVRAQNVSCAICVFSMPGGTENKAIGLAAEDFIASSLREIHQEGISTQVCLSLENGSIRIVDVFDSPCGEMKEVKRFQRRRRSWNR